MDAKITLFEKREVRRVWHENQWWFAITDVIAILIDNERPRKYWNDLKRKLLPVHILEQS